MKVCSRTLSMPDAFMWLTMVISSPPAEMSLIFGASPGLVVPFKRLAMSCLTSDTEEPESSITSTIIPPTSPFTTDVLLMDATNAASIGLTGVQGVCCPLQAPLWSFPNTGRCMRADFDNFYECDQLSRNGNNVLAVGVR